MKTQFEEIRQVWLNALNECRTEDLLMHFPSGKFGYDVDCDMTCLEAVETFLASTTLARLKHKPIRIKPNGEA